MTHSVHFLHVRCWLYSCNYTLAGPITIPRERNLRVDVWHVATHDDEQQRDYDQLEHFEAKGDVLRIEDVSLLGDRFYNGWAPKTKGESDYAFQV